MSASKNQRGGPHHHLLGSGRAWSAGLATIVGRAACCRCGCLALVNGGFASFGVRARRLVRRHLGEGCAGGSLAGGVKADFKRSVDESLA
jgi:hypothetical protein